MLADWDVNNKTVYGKYIFLIIEVAALCVRVRAWGRKFCKHEIYHSHYAILVTIGSTCMNICYVVDHERERSHMFHCIVCSVRFDIFK
jgi:hypothetical protein